MELILNLFGIGFVGLIFFIGIGLIIINYEDTKLKKNKLENFNNGRR